MSVSWNSSDNPIPFDKPRLQMSPSSNPLPPIFNGAAPAPIEILGGIFISTATLEVVLLLLLCCPGFCCVSCASALTVAPALAALALVFAIAVLLLLFLLTPALALSHCALRVIWSLETFPPKSRLGFKGWENFGRIGPKVFLLLGGCLINGGSD